MSAVISRADEKPLGPFPGKLTGQQLCEARKACEAGDKGISAKGVEKVGKRIVLTGGGTAGIPERQSAIGLFQDRVS